MDGSFFEAVLLRAKIFVWALRRIFENTCVKILRSSNMKIFERSRKYPTLLRSKISLRFVFDPSISLRVNPERSRRIELRRVLLRSPSSKYFHL